MRINNLAGKYADEYKTKNHERFVRDWIVKNLPKKYKGKFEYWAWQPCIMMSERPKKTHIRRTLVAKLQLPNLAFVFSRDILPLIKRLGTEYEKICGEEYEIIVDCPDVRPRSPKEIRVR